MNKKRTLTELENMLDDGAMMCREAMINAKRLEEELQFTFNYIDRIVKRLDTAQTRFLRAGTEIGLELAKLEEGDE